MIQSRITRDGITENVASLRSPAYLLSPAIPFTYKAKPSGARLSREMGVRYVLEARNKADNQRVTTQLVDAMTENNFGLSTTTPARTSPAR
jgi:TolB-like protein